MKIFCEISTEFYNSGLMTETKQNASYIAFKYHIQVLHDFCQQSAHPTSKDLATSSAGILLNKIHVAKSVATDLRLSNKEISDLL